jgi:hypothetical protein
MLETATTDAAPELAGDNADLLAGAAAIAAHAGQTERQIEHLLSMGRLPAFKLGGRWYMRKSTYRRFLQELEDAALKAARHNATNTAKAPPKRKQGARRDTRAAA